MTTSVSPDQVKEAILAKMAATQAIDKAKKGVYRTPVLLKEEGSSQGISSTAIIGAAVVFGLGLLAGAGYNTHA